MNDVLISPEFEEWFDGLTTANQRAVVNVIEKLQVAGLALGEPHSSAVEVTEKPLRELRPKRGRSPLRVFYAFNRKRNAIVLLGGDKSKDKKFYANLIPLVEKLYDKYQDLT